MYLLYDVMQRRRSALGNSLLVKRGDYRAVQEIMSSLSYERLTAAAQSLRETQTTSDPAIATLRRAIETVASRVPNSFAEKREMRLLLRGLLIEFGLAAFWLTINPSDLRDPLVLRPTSEQWKRMAAVCCISIVWCGLLETSTSST